MDGRDSYRAANREDPDTRAFYEIRVQGHLASEWSEWFEPMTLRQLETGETLLSGLVRDQAALHGLLRKIRDLGLELLAVNRVEAEDRFARPGSE